MANANQAVAPAQSAVASATAELFGSAEIETIEQLGRDYWVAEDAKAKAERKIGSCDVALFDIVKGMNYPAFMQVRVHFVTGCRDKGAPTDEAASKTWERYKHAAKCQPCHDMYFRFVQKIDCNALDSANPYIKSTLPAKISPAIHSRI